MIGRIEIGDKGDIPIWMIFRITVSRGLRSHVDWMEICHKGGREGDGQEHGDSLGDLNQTNCSFGL